MPTPCRNQGYNNLSKHFLWSLLLCSILSSFTSRSAAWQQMKSVLLRFLTMLNIKLKKNLYLLLFDVIQVGNFKKKKMRIGESDARSKEMTLSRKSRLGLEIQGNF